MGSTNGTSCPLKTILANTASASRFFLVNARVSTPYMPGTLCSCNNSKDEIVKLKKKKRKKKTFTTMTAATTIFMFYKNMTVGTNYQKKGEKGEVRKPTKHTNLEPGVQ